MVANIRVALLLLVLLISTSLHAAVESRIDRQHIEQGDTFSLVIDMSGIDASQLDLAPLEIDFQVLGRSQQSSTVMTNGNIESTVELVLTLLPKRAGNLQVPAITVDGESTQAHSIVVSKVDLPAVEQGGIEIESTLSTQTPYVQQPIIYNATMRLGRQVSNVSLQPPMIRSGKAIVEPIGEQKQSRQIVDGNEITIVEQSWAITPEESGHLDIAAAQLIGEMPRGERRRMDTFGGGLFPGRANMKRVQTSAEDYQLTVEPIPADNRSSTWLPATNVTLVEQWSSEELKVGEPVTRIVTLIVEGLASNQMPAVEWPEIAGMKQYPATPEVSQKYRDGNLTSMFIQEITLIPTEEGQQTIPEFTLNWWNVEENKAATSSLPSHQFDVQAGTLAPGLVEPVAPIIEQADANQINQPEAPAPLSTTDVATTAPPLMSNLWAGLIGAVLGGAITFLWLSLFKKKSPSIQQSQQVDNEKINPKLYLQQLKHACDNNDSASARKALLSWAQCYCAACLSLNQLGLRVGGELQQAITQLNQQTYSESPSQWNGQDLWQAVSAVDVSDLNEDKDSKQSELVELYLG